MKISHWILAIGLVAGAWAPAAATPKQAADHAARPRIVAARHAAKKSHASRAAHAKAHAARRKDAEHKALRRHNRVARHKAAQHRVAQHKAAQHKAEETARNRKPARKRKHQRDPFVSPIVVRRPGGVPCTGTGRQCLAVGDLRLEGVAETPNGNIAVVVSGIHTYFLRDRDPLADGEVLRITGDSIIMLQRTRDAVGRSVEREVIRNIPRPAA